MKLKIIAITFISFYSLFLQTNIGVAEEKEKIDYGKFSVQQLEQIVEISTLFKDEGEKIDYISSKFMGTAYEENTLTGNINTPEVFTINLRGIDCFTYLDYVEGLRISKAFHQFEDDVKATRYQKARVEFKKRNHFFSDWPVYNKDKIKDVTKEVGGENTKSTTKYLNKKEDGLVYLPGIPVVEREIFYIPSESINDDITEKMNTGDYVGIYTDKEGLDVSHTGIIIKKKDKVYLRHASSKEIYRKVVEEDLVEYFSDKPGLVIFRSK